MIEPLITEMKSHFDELSSYQEKVVSASGIKCLEGCGACCKSPNVEATAAEMLPLAEFVLENPKWTDVLDQLHAAEAPCVFYKAASSDGERGRCSVYAHRPSICRLFGSSVQKRKDGKMELSVCTKQKEFYKSEIEKANQEINLQQNIPTMQDFGQKLKMKLLSHGHLSESLPINQAAALAIEVLAFHHQMNGQMNGDDRCLREGR